MKKIVFCIHLIIFNIIFLFSQNISIPTEIEGIWEGKDRIVFFENNESHNNLVLLLKNFYGWYYDRVGEPNEYSNQFKRSKNNTTSRKGEIIELNVNSKTSFYEVELTYSKLQKNYVPIVIINDCIFLDFYTKINDDFLPNDENIYNGFWQGHCVSKGILLSEQSIPKEIVSYYIFNDKIYPIRYWITDMEYSSDYVELNSDDNKFFVPKHINTGGNTYTCVNGRSKKIRNVNKPITFNPENYLFNEKNECFVIDKQPYLVKIADAKTFSDYMQIVNKANSRRKPKRKPLFPPNDLNWHWDLIDELEKNNKLIQEVRKRQLQFGPRPKDL